MNTRPTYKCSATSGAPSACNGAVLHWDKNSRILQNGDLVVVDAAAEYGRYASDVTRTYPVSGHFTADQARVYRAVYQAQGRLKDSAFASRTRC